ncbi:MFS transporter [Streptomyces thinghirensis]|nr:MFS transporter [Streptomyces thinghirensis]
MQAVGGSMLNPVAMSIITNTFTDPRERARAIGVWGAVVGISMAAGPLVGGLLVESVGWRSIFWVNLPAGLVALALTVRFVPESRAPKARRPDPPGQLMVIVLFGPLTYAIIEAPHAGPATVLPFAALAPRRAARPPPVRTPPHRTPHRPALLPLGTVQRSHRDRGQRLRRAGRLPVPVHAVPAERARAERPARGFVDAADGRADLSVRPAVRAAGRHPGGRGCRC